MTGINTQMGHDTVVAEHNTTRGPAPKWAILLTDALCPMPRRKMRARDILDQCGAGGSAMLQRDHGGTHDVVFPDGAEVDLAEGNVFRITESCGERQASPQTPAKLAFVLDDHWEVTLNPRQTGHSLKHLFGVPDDSELLRDFESPTDKLIQNGDAVLFSDGPVFTLRHVTLTVTVNNKEVRLTGSSATARQIKETAIAQHVNIQIGFVLFRIKPDGSISAALPDDKILRLKQGDAFRCVAADDTSWH
jgi:hypothetical protein